jgi:flavin reductase (DIM6/NTAB) family NADH-FMN oxidoreductase RutF
VHELPDWSPGTVTILSTGGPPHGIPVSTALRAGPRTVLIALGLKRGSLARLREDPRCALTILDGLDVAFTAHAAAAVLQEPMAVSDRVAAVRLDVLAIQDHGRPRFTIEAGVRWRWTDAQAERDDAVIRAGLAELAARLG